MAFNMTFKFEKDEGEEKDIGSCKAIKDYISRLGEAPFSKG